MKKILLFTLFAVILVSCRGPKGNDGLLSVWKVIEIPVAASDWQAYRDSEGLNLYYAVDVPVPEITRDIFLDGLIQCYLYNDGRQIVLPSVRHYQNKFGDYWTQTIDYEYYVNGISFYVTNSDFAIDPPGNMLFVLQILY